jgi:hypothetical protein
MHVSTRAPTGGAAADLTPRILPHHAQALGAEIRQIVWQK